MSINTVTKQNKESDPCFNGPYEGGRQTQHGQESTFALLTTSKA